MNWHHLSSFFFSFPFVFSCAWTIQGNEQFDMRKERKLLTIEGDHLELSNKGRLKLIDPDETRDFNSTEV